ncbi:MAG TPA: glycosyl transferase family 1, partial [Flavobacteriaceae bacterium]|nr:glycosyl transferase family 1 [Flavobacteriaceae bacterium]
MKILIVNISDIQGGAARAAYRLHKALLVENVDSEMLVLHKHSD